MEDRSRSPSTGLSGLLRNADSVNLPIGHYPHLVLPLVIYVLLLLWLSVATLLSVVREVAAYHAHGCGPYRWKPVLGVCDSVQDPVENDPDNNITDAMFTTHVISNKHAMAGATYQFELYGDRLIQVLRPHLRCVGNGVGGRTITAYKQA